MAKKSMIVKVEAPAALQNAAAQSLPAVRPPARVHPPIHAVPHLLPQAGAGGRDPRRHQSELVSRMTMSDPIADMLTRIRNASRARHASCEMPFSR